MKELSIEEKAKRYDIAVEQIRELRGMLLNNGVIKNDGVINSGFQRIFPELVESEDERIRRELIFYLGDMPEDTELRNGVTNRDVLAWLEKQGEQETVSKVKIGEKYRCSNSVRYTCFQIGKVYEVKDSFDAAMISLCLDCFALVDDNAVQKPADKVEPKFEVGDWIVVNDGRIGRIIECTKDFADVDLAFSVLSTSINNISSWTILDAKDGDVIANGSNIFIFSHLSPTRAMGYCHINLDDRRFYDDKGKNEYFGFIDAAFTPATKEQRDLLFKKMHEAGYAWDAEKKELTKIEQNPAWRASKEQLKALEATIEFLGCPRKVREELKSLYEQLKKLREE